jgi:glycerophosphoryl diester phosphodiesterase
VLGAGSRPGHPYLAGAPLLVAHRGGSRLAPENTMPAFHQAVDVWRADVLETDVHLSADGKLVVIHDATVDRTTDGTGPVRDLGWARLRELDAGHRFVALDGGTPFRGTGVRLPLFEDVLEAFPRMRINVESKAPEAAAPLVAAIERHGARDRVLIAAEHERNRVAARGYLGPWGASTPQVAGLRFLPFGYTPRADIVQVCEWWHGIRVVTPGLIARAHARNSPVQVWTVDDPADMHRLLAMGVDGIQTDRPDVLARVLGEVTRRPAPPGLTVQSAGRSRAR